MDLGRDKHPRDNAADGAAGRHSPVPVRLRRVHLYGHKTGTVDYSNVNDFDFPIDLQTYANPGAQTPAESSTFTGNTCQIVNAMKTAVQKLGAAADWTSIEKTTNGQFVRIIAPDNGYATDGGWPSMVPYIENLAQSLPLHGTTYGPITVEDHYATTAGHDPQHNGWFNYQGYFNKTTLP